MAIETLSTEMSSVEEYLSAEEASEGRLELWHSRVYGMAGASANHIVVQANLSRLCGTALRGRECRFVGENAKVVVAETNSAYHPDGTIARPLKFSNEKAGVVENPRVVFEILSPSTELHDRKSKFRDYMLMPSIQEIVFIETETARVEVHERREEGWLMRAYLPGSTARLVSVEIELPLDELYENATFEPAAIQAEGTSP